MLKLLIAIRSTELADALTQLLSSHFAVHRCSSGAQARCLLNSLQPDALVIDLRLPDGDGFSVLRSCQHKPAAILAVTDLINEDISQAAVKTGIHALAVMPCSARYMAESLRGMFKK